jgi:flagella basal body P-ring formation protein FlgA
MHLLPARCLSGLACAAIPAASLAQSPYIEPAAIDRAVERFTGKAAGAIGGARRAADPRLKLAACAKPLAVSWHGTPGRTAKVACANSAKPWQIFVAVNPQPRAGKAPDAIKRGDQLTVAVQGAGFSIRRPAIAAEAGAIGEWIAVRMERKGPSVSAKIIRPGLAAITLASAQSPRAAQQFSARP